MSNKKAIKRAKKALEKAQVHLEAGQDLVDIMGGGLQDDTGHGYAELVDGIVEEVSEVEFSGWNDGELSDRVRTAVTFDRHQNGLALVKITFTKNKLVSITKFKPDVPQAAKNHASRILEEEIMKAKKLPPEND